MLYASASYFPRGTVFLAVVDPDVGTERNAVAVECSEHFFVGPDNGVLYPAAAREGIIRSIKLENSGGTFDGRDVFAPAAARISLGNSIEKLGKIVSLNVKYEFGYATIGDVWVDAKIIHVDKFGDAVTNIKSKQLAGINSIKYRGKTIHRARSFSGCSDICFIEGSSGFIEIVANMQRASEALNLSTNQNMRIELL